MDIRAVSSDTRWIAALVVASTAAEGWLDLTLVAQVTTQIDSIRVASAATLPWTNECVPCCPYWPKPIAFIFRMKFRFYHCFTRLFSGRLVTEHTVWRPCGK